MRSEVQLPVMTGFETNADRRWRTSFPSSLVDVSVLINTSISSRWISGRKESDLPCRNEFDAVAALSAGVRTCGEEVAEEEAGLEAFRLAGLHGGRREAEGEAEGHEGEQDDFVGRHFEGWVEI
jgi:hypothetical protein